MAGIGHGGGGAMQYGAGGSGGGGNTPHNMRFPGTGHQAAAAMERRAAAIQVSAVRGRRMMGGAWDNVLSGCAITTVLLRRRSL